MGEGRGGGSGVGVEENYDMISESGETLISNSNFFFFFFGLENLFYIITPSPSPQLNTKKKKNYDVKILPALSFFSIIIYLSVLFFSFLTFLLLCVYSVCIFCFVYSVFRFCLYILLVYLYFDSLSCYSNERPNELGPSTSKMVQAQDIIV